MINNSRYLMVIKMGFEMEMIFYSFSLSRKRNYKEVYC
ncbi:hypothetical protein JCM19275_2223 [Nonlabens ulvanivorans]|uniref:Uncharacterized protein n=1 Tax=Nonlabens ulvanivorans TaxID=906888 RepID=A0A090WGJ5_NONUL|nr:hypothetical protein JCM19275_2223 [Nonlabens ulvanivorans]